MQKLFLIASLPLFVGGCQFDQTTGETDSRLMPAANSWYINGNRAVLDQQELLQQQGLRFSAAKNVILFVGDGMSLPTIAAARIFEGQRHGASGEENHLSFEQFPFTGLSKTYNVDAQTPDSAGTMTAMMSGVKTNMGIIGQSEVASMSICDPSKNADVVSALELAEIAGMKTGVVTTTRVTHATPAATYAHSPDRNWEDISDMPEDAVKAGCLDIAAQLIEFPDYLKSRFGVLSDGPDVMFGGGRRHFLPADASLNTSDADSPVEGDRKDGRNLLVEWQQRHPQGQLLTTQVEFDQIAADAALPVLGLFSESHMRFGSDRANDVGGEPDLTSMTEKAIRLLSQSGDGYLLIVEGGRIDHAHHAGNAYHALDETVSLASAVRRAEELTSPDDTLIIVTSDHGHVMTFGGYPKRGNPILGKVINPGESEPAEAADGLHYTTLSYANGMGMMEMEVGDPETRYSEALNAGRQNLTKVDTESAGYHQEALVPMYAETHSGEDVGIYANGPYAVLATGVHEQNDIFHIINAALQLSYRASAKLPPAK